MRPAQPGVEGALAVEAGGGRGAVVGDAAGGGVARDALGVVHGTHCAPHSRGGAAITCPQILYLIKYILVSSKRTFRLFEEHFFNVLLSYKTHDTFAILISTH